MIRSLLLFLFLLCTSCIQFGGEPQPVSYYLLQPAESAADPADIPPLHLALKKVDIPAYLDRLQLVSRTTGHQVTFADSDRWAEPLQENLTRVLQENLSRQLPVSGFSTPPWQTLDEADDLIEVEVIRFDGIVGEKVEVGIRWALRSPDNKINSKEGDFSTEKSISGGYGEYVAALNEAYTLFCRQLAEALIARHDR